MFTLTLTLMMLAWMLVLGLFGDVLWSQRDEPVEPIPLRPLVVIEGSATFAEATSAAAS